MPDIQVVRNQVTSYGERGFVSQSEDAHVKLLATFRTNGTLRKLQGAPLSAFIDVALSEACEPPGVTMRQIENDTGVSYRHLLRVMPQLCADGFCAIGGTDEAGNQIYRVAAYAWFGKANRAVPSSRGSNTRPTNPPARGSNTPEQLPLVGGSNTDTRPGTASNSSQNQNARASDKMSHDKMSYAIGVPNNKNGTALNSSSLENESLLLNIAIFRKLHVGEPKRTKLAQTVSHTLAERWAQWVPLAVFHPSGKYYSPVGWMIKSLENDPETEPPDLELLLERDREETARVARQRKYARAIESGEISVETTLHAPDTDTEASRIWSVVTADMQLQMTKATFDAWIRPTRAIHYDASLAHLTVRLRNEYAKQWLENRLSGMVLRALEMHLGKPATVEYVMLEESDETE